MSTDEKWEDPYEDDEDDPCYECEAESCEGCKYF